MHSGRSAAKRASVMSQLVCTAASSGGRACGLITWAGAGTGAGAGVAGWRVAGASLLTRRVGVADLAQQVFGQLLVVGKHHLDAALGRRALGAQGLGMRRRIAELVELGELVDLGEGVDAEDEVGHGGVSDATQT